MWSAGPEGLTGWSCGEGEGITTGAGAPAGAGSLGGALRKAQGERVGSGMLIPGDGVLTDGLKPRN